MVKAFFKAKCPLEVGDTVAILPGQPTTLYYLSDGIRLDDETAKTAELHRITEIVAQHYVKAQKVVFAYQLDGGEDLITYDVKVPNMQTVNAVENGGGVNLP